MGKRTPEETAGPLIPPPRLHDPLTDRPVVGYVSMEAALEAAQRQPTTKSLQETVAGVRAASPNPLSIPALTDPIGHARELALAAAEICRSRATMLPQSRVQAIRLLNMAIAVLGT